MSVFQPANAAAAAETVAWAAEQGEALEIRAGGSKRGFGRPPRTPHVLDIGALSGVIDYDPAELVLTAHAATPLAGIAALLGEHRQMLAFEPPGWHAMFGGNGAPTLGGVIACNSAGPRRIRAGAARDHLLGFAAINGWGDGWKAGGRVVKNVSGYDMCKLQCGAMGTLSVLTELSLRVVPLPETERTVLFTGLDDATAIALLADALNTPHEVSAAAYLPAGIAARALVAGMGAVAAVRLEGHAPSVAERTGHVAKLSAAAAIIDAAASARLWSEIGAVHTLLPPAGRIIWRICPTPSQAPGVVADIRARCPSAEAFYDWAGGQIWLSLDDSDAAAGSVRGALRGAGHATLIRAPDTVRATIDVFEPAPPALAALADRVKHGFDPRHILNPGRMRDRPEPR